MTGKARILIVDDHPLVREWLGNLIERSPDLAVCGEAEDSEEALKLIAEIKRILRSLTCRSARFRAWISSGKSAPLFPMSR
jgi:DNA-binding NarL/FixJ family response regulator